MKILFFINTMTSGGKERRLTELIKGLKSKPDIEFELAIMCTDIHYKEIFDLDVNLHYIIRKKKKDLSVFRKFYTLCKKYKPDIVHCWDGMTAIYSVPICKLLKIKLVNGMVVNVPVRKAISNKAFFRAKLTFPFSDIVIGNSQAGLAAYKASPQKSVCIHNGFDFERVRSIQRGDILKNQLGIITKHIIGMIASFSEFKDYKTYFTAAQSVLKTRNDVTFIAVGSYTDSDDAQKLIQDKFKKQFRLLGKRSDIESLISIFDICVLSTFTEGISNSILEYMAMKKPVIATEGGGTNEIVIDKKTGFLVNQQDPQELAEKIETLLENDALRMTMGTAGKQRICDSFSIHEMIAKYLSVYKNLNAQ